MALSKRPSNVNQVPALKQRISELEEQVADYKKRLDELRKAKNTTILKREREIIDVRAPELGKRDSKLQDAKIAQLEQKMRDLKTNQSKSSTVNNACDHGEQIKTMQQIIDEQNTELMALRIENTDLRERVDKLSTDLSIKEAKWCETEEQLNLKIKQQWGEKYKDWMEETERKISDLQEANSVLKAYINRTRPGHEDPTTRN